MPGSAASTPTGSRLLVVTDDAGRAREVQQQLSGQSDVPGAVEAVAGLYGGLTASRRAVPVVIVVVDPTNSLELWRLGALRSELPDAAMIVVSDIAGRDELAGAVRAHLVVGTAAELPPLRELTRGGRALAESATASPDVVNLPTDDLPTSPVREPGQSSTDLSTAERHASRPSAAS